MPQIIIPLRETFSHGYFKSYNFYFTVYPLPSIQAVNAFL